MRQGRSKVQKMVGPQFIGGMAASNSDILGPNLIILSIALEKMGGGPLAP